MGHGSHEPWKYVDEEDQDQASEEDMLAARQQEHEERLATVLQRYHTWRCNPEQGCSCDAAREEFAAMAEATVAILAKYYSDPTQFCVTDLQYF